MQVTPQSPVEAQGLGSVIDRTFPGWFRPVPDLPTVAKVDVEQYAGEWFELARLPTRFQDPLSVSKATYTPNEDGSLTVFNQAFRGTEEVSSITGRATSANPGEDTRLKVKFGGLLKLLPVQSAGNYYVLDLADDYSLALVGSPNRDNLWLLGRDPQLWESARAAEMVQRAGELGYDTSRLGVADWQAGELRPAGAADAASGGTAVAAVAAQGG